MKPATASTATETPHDAVLLERIVAGDGDAMAALMRRHNRRLFRAARSILRDDAEAEDALQEAYLRAYRALGGFRAESDLSTWLVRIVVNEALSRLRERRRRSGVVALAGDRIAENARADDDAISEDRTMRPEDQALRADLRRILEARIDALPDAFRSVFVLRAVEEMSVDETAQCLGLEAATVRTRHFRARAMLREALARDIDLGVEDAFAFDGARCDRIVAAVLDRLRMEPPPLR